jgi:hypothetical protein
MFDRGPGSLPGSSREAGGGEIPSTRTNRRVEKLWHELFPRLVLFRLVAPPLQLRVVGPFPGMRCMVS